jgi:hypothetical protein
MPYDSPTSEIMKECLNSNLPELLSGKIMFDEKKTKERIMADLKDMSSELEEDIDMLANDELWKELEELEEMMNSAG